MKRSDHSCFDPPMNCAAGVHHQHSSRLISLSLPGRHIPADRGSFGIENSAPLRGFFSESPRIEQALDLHCGCWQRSSQASPPWSLPHTSWESILPHTPSRTIAGAAARRGGTSPTLVPIILALATVLAVPGLRPSGIHNPQDDPHQICDSVVTWEACWVPYGGLTVDRPPTGFERSH